MNKARRNLLGALFVCLVLVIDGFLLIEQENSAVGMVWVDTHDPAVANSELPTTVAEMPSFWIDSQTVTEQQFHDFVQATGYEVSAETGAPGDQAAGDWRTVINSHDGKHSKLYNLTLQDAKAYCRWLGKKLSNQTQVEIAARDAAIQSRREGFRCIMHHRSNDLTAIWLN